MNTEIIKSENEVTIFDNGQAYISQRKLAELTTVNRSTIQSFIKNHPDNFDTKQGVSSELALKVIQNYAFKNNKVCQDLLSKISLAGMKAYLYHLAGYEMKAEKPKPKSALELARENARLALEQVELLEELEATKEKLEHKTIQLDESMEWLSIKRIAKINGCTWKDLSWRKLKAHGLTIGKPPIKRFDANYGQVNTYHISSWRYCYPDLIYPATNDSDIPLLKND